MRCSAAVSVPILTLNTVGPTLLSMEPKRRSGFIHLGFGGYVPLLDRLHRAWRGTDLASLTTSAKRQEITSSTVKDLLVADHADHFWLAVRTDRARPSTKAVHVDRGRGQPRRLDDAHPGVGDNNISAVYFENVQVPLENLVGTEGGGWRLLIASSTTSAWRCAQGPLERLWEETRLCSRCGGRRRDPAARSPCAS